MKREELKSLIVKNDRLERIERFLQDLENHTPKSAELIVAQHGDSISDYHTSLGVDIKAILPLIEREREGLVKEIEIAGGRK